MKHTIRNRWTGNEIFSADCETMRACVERAVASSADLSSADLYGTNLSRANLYRANLSSANLSRANLSRAKGLDPYRADALRLLEFQIGKVRAFKLVDADGRSPTRRTGKITYVPGETVSAIANEDPNEDCGAGINLCDIAWALRQAQGNYRIMLCEFSRKDLACIPLGTDGKFRVHRCKVVREILPAEFGLSDGWSDPGQKEAEQAEARR